MFIQFKEPLRSIRRIGVKPWYIHRCQPNRVIHTLRYNQITTQSKPTHLFQYRRSYTTKTALQTQVTAEIISNQSIHVKDPLTSPKHHQSSTTTLKEYEQILSVSAQNRQWEQVIQSFQNVKSAGFHPSPSMYLTAIKAYGNLNESNLVTRTFKEYKKRYRLKPSAYQHYIRAILDCNDTVTASKIFYDVKSNPKLSAKEASLCLAELVQHKHIQTPLVFKIVEDLYQSTLICDWDTTSLRNITHALWSRHVQLLQLPDTPMSALSLEMLVSTYTNQLKPAQYNILLQLLGHQHITPTVKTCNLVLEAQSDVQDFAGMRSVIVLMQKLDIDPNIDTVSVLLRTFGNSLAIDEAEKLFDSLKHDASVYKAFVKIFASHSVSKAQHVVSEMKKNNMSMDTATFMALAEGFVKRNEFDQGLAWLQESNCQDLDAYAVLMEGLLNCGEWKACVSHYRTLIDTFERSKVDLNHRIVKCMLAAQFSQNNMEACDEYLSSKLKFKFTPNTVIRVINTLLNLQNKYGDAIVPGHIIVKSLKVLESRLHVYLDAEGISRIITRLGERGECLESYQLYKWVREHGHEKSRERCGHGKIYKALMFSATKNNNVRILERAWIDMQYRKQFFGKLVKELHSLSSYNLLLNGYASQLPHPDIKRLKKTFQKMLNQKVEPDLITYNILIKAFVNTNNMNAAKQVYMKMIRDPRIQPDARSTNTLIHGWIVRKDWAHVEQFVEELQKQSSGNLDMVTFNLLVQSFLQLDSKSMSYEHLLKNQHKWKELKGFTASKSEKQSMSSETIWNIFESSTGYKKSLLDAAPVSHPSVIEKYDPNYICDKLCNLKTEPMPSPDPKAFVKLFSSEANQITYKLFMKAFVNIGDYESASKVYQWMKQRHAL